MRRWGAEVSPLRVLVVATWLVLGGTGRVDDTLASPSRRPVTEPHGSAIHIVENQTWSGDILVPRTGLIVGAGVTLTIEPGTTVRFVHARRGPRSALWVEGRLIAMGTPERPIRFTSDAVPPEHGDWAGIRLARGSAGSILDHVIVEFGGYGVYVEDTVTISNSIVRWTTGAALPLYGDATVTRNRIYQTGASPIEVHYRTKPIITYNTLWGAAIASGIRTEGFSRPTIAHNIIRDNMGSGIGITWSSAADVQLNSITGNRVGVSIGQSGDALSSIVEHNNVRQNTQLDMEQQVPQALDATHNWWGTTDEAAIEARMYQHPGGQIVYKPFETAPVDIGLVTYDWDNSEVYAHLPKTAYDTYQYVYSDSDATRSIETMIKAQSMSDGIAWDGRWLYVAIPGNPTDTIYRMDATGNVTGSFPSPATQTMGLAFDGQDLWVLDYAQGRVFETDRTGRVLTSIAAPCEEPQGLAFDGQYLWTLTNQVHGRAFQFDRSGALVRTLQTPGYSGLAWDGKYLWVNGQPDQLTQVDPTNGHIIRQITSSGVDTQYLTWQEPDLWSVEWGDGTGERVWLVKMRPAKESITLDGLRVDWKGRAPLLLDPQGDNTGRATDIKSVYGFIDGVSLNLMLDFHEFAGYDYAYFEVDVNGDRQPDYSIGGFFPGEIRDVVLHNFATGQDTWVRHFFDFAGTELHSNAKEVAEFRIPIELFGGSRSLAVRCTLSAFAGTASSVVDQTDWATVRWDRIRRHLSSR